MHKQSKRSLTLELEGQNLLYILKLADMMEADELNDLMPEYKDAAKQAVEQIKAIIDNCEIY
jgi:hypothetical protein